MNPPKYPPISAIEFASILNGCSSNATSSSISSSRRHTLQTAQQIRHTLRRFVYTIRCDRIAAFAVNGNDEMHPRYTVSWSDLDDGDEDEDGNKDTDTDTDTDTDESNNDDTTEKKNHDDDADERIPMKRGYDDTLTHENDDPDVEDKDVRPSTTTKDTQQQPSSKKTKFRTKKNEKSWKDDIASYNVPFVGTNIASSLLARNHHTSHHSSSSVRQQNDPVWPSGLLHTYLYNSPMAVELFQNEFLSLPSTSSLSTPVTTTTAATISRSNKNIHVALLNLISTTTSSGSTSTSAKEQSYIRYLSQSIVHLYLLAISELITAAIPHDRLEQELHFWNPTSAIRSLHFPNEDTNNHRPSDSLPQFITEYILQSQSQLSQLRFIPHMLQILLQDVAGWKKKSTTNRTYQPTLVTTTIMTILRRLSCISITTARSILRYMEQTIPNVTLRSLLSYPTTTLQQPQEVVRGNSDLEYSIVSTNSTNIDEMPTQPQLSAYLLTVNFIVTILEMDDPTLFHCISNHYYSTKSSDGNSNSRSINTTGGGRNDQGHPPQQQQPLGMLFVVLQRGLPSITTNEVISRFSVVPQQQQHQKTHTATIRLLQALRRIVIRRYTSHQHHRALLEFWTRDSVQSLLHMTLHWAPPLHNYEHVLAMTDGPRQPSNREMEIDNCNTQHVAIADDPTTKTTTDPSLLDSWKRSQEEAGIEARRLLFLLLCDPIHSPLLQSIQFAHRTHKSTINTNKNVKYESMIQVIVRTILQMLTHVSIAHSSTVEMQRFVVQIMTVTPILFSDMLRVLQISDNHHQASITILSQMNFMSLALRRGPRVLDCVEHVDLSSLEADLNDGSRTTIDTILFAIVPAGLSRARFVKLLHHADPLISYEAHKLLLITLNRCRDYIEDLTRNKSSHSTVIPKVLEVLQQSVPDVPSLTSVFTKLSA
jgi:hypothetical protein